MFYYGRYLPIGTGGSCRISETFSCALQWIMCSKFQVGGMSRLIDDFFSLVERVLQIVKRI